MDDTTKRDLENKILVAVFHAVGASGLWTEKLRLIARAEAKRRGGDEWDALEALMALRQAGHVETTRNYERGGLTASGLCMARTPITRES